MDKLRREQLRKWQMSPAALCSESDNQSMRHSVSAVAYEVGVSQAVNGEFTIQAAIGF